MRKFVITLVSVAALMFAGISPAAAATSAWTPESTCVLPNVLDAKVKTQVQLGSNGKDWAISVSNRASGSIGIAPALTTGYGSIYDNGVYKGFTSVNFGGNPGSKGLGTTYQNGGVVRGHTYKIVWQFDNWYGSHCSVTNSVTAP